MDKINARFQELLKERHFPMKIEEEDDSYVYYGKFQLEDTHQIKFSVSISKGDSKAVGQIIFENLAYYRSSDDRLEWLQLINKLNITDAVYYYFCLNHDDYVFMRYITELTTDLDPFFNILLQGPYLIQRVLPKIEEKFGRFVVI